MSGDGVSRKGDHACLYRETSRTETYARTRFRLECKYCCAVLRASIAKRADEDGFEAYGPVGKLWAREGPPFDDEGGPIEMVPD